MFYKSNKNRFYIGLILLLSSYTIQISSMQFDSLSHIETQNIEESKKIDKIYAFPWYDARYYTSRKHFFPVAIAAFSLAGYLAKQHVAEKNKIPFILKKQDMFRILSTAGLAAAMFENRNGEAKSTQLPYFRKHTAKQLFTTLWLATNLWDLRCTVRTNFDEAKNITGACSLFEPILSPLGVYSLLKNFAASINTELKSSTDDALGSEDDQERLATLTELVALEKILVKNNATSSELSEQDKKIEAALQNLKEFKTGLLEETSRTYLLGSRFALQPFSIATAIVSGLLFHYQFLQKSPRDAVIATAKLAGMITLATAQFRDMPMQQAVASVVAGILLYESFQAFYNNSANCEGSLFRPVTLKDLFEKVEKLGILQTVVTTLSSEIIDQILDQEPKKSKKAEDIREKLRQSAEEIVQHLEIELDQERHEKKLLNDNLQFLNEKIQNTVTDNENPQFFSNKNKENFVLMSKALYEKLSASAQKPAEKEHHEKAD